jgi:hypothetical protein
MLCLARAGLAIFALAATACSFDTRGLIALDARPPVLEGGPPPAPDGVQLELTDIAQMQPQLDLGGKPPPDLPPDSPRPRDLAPDQPVDLPPASCAATCAGCCQGETCVTAVTHQVCGLGGAPCVNCTSSGEQCVSMVCVPITCATSATCPADKVCSGGVCASPFGLHYRIVILEAKINPKTTTGGAWDNNGSAPDPYVVITIGGVSWYTTTKLDTLQPSWKEYVPYTVGAATAIRFEVRDSDVNSSTLIGAIELKPVPATVLHAGTYTGANGGVGSLTIAFKLQ